MPETTHDEFTSHFREIEICRDALGSTYTLVGAGFCANPRTCTDRSVDATKCFHYIFGRCYHLSRPTLLRYYPLATVNAGFFRWQTIPHSQRLRARFVPSCLDTRLKSRSLRW